jgi:hypothetical protein
MWYFQSAPVQQDTQPSIQESNSHKLPPLTLHQRNLAYTADNIQLQVYARGFFYSFADSASLRDISPLTLLLVF